jgi:hypothetical protein
MGRASVDMEKLIVVALPGIELLLPMNYNPITGRVASATRWPVLTGEARESTEES